MPLPNARFWVYWNQQHTKLTIKPGQTLRMFRTGATDEGYAYEGEEYYYDPELRVIHNTRDSGGSDCDGPIDYHNEWICQVNRLHDQQMFIDGEPAKGTIQMPAWQCERSWQRDHYAEAMGY